MTVSHITYSVTGGTIRKFLGGIMNKVTLVTLLVSAFMLSGCDDKQEKIDFYMKAENAGAYHKGLALCKTGSSEAKDCDAIYEVQGMKEKDKAADKKDKFKKEFSFDH